MIARTLTGAAAAVGAAFDSAFCCAAPLVAIVLAAFPWWSGWMLS